MKHKSLPEKVFIYTLFISGIFLLNTTHPQPYKFRHITTKDGLTQNSVTAILQDNEGFIWIGTYGGLNKFDGNTIIHYTFDADDSLSISNNAIKYIYEDSKNDLWIGCYNGGLNKFDRQKEQFIHYTNPFDSTHYGSLENILAIVEDSAGILWVASEGGLCAFDPQEGKYLAYYYKFAAHPENLNTREVFDFYLQGSYLWLAIRNRFGAFDLKEKKYINYFNLPDFITYRITKDQKGFFWLASFKDGLIKYDIKNNKIKRFSTSKNSKPQLISDNIESIYTDNKNNIWIGTRDNGINLLNSVTGDISLIHRDKTDPNSISNNFIFTFYRDRTGVFWIGTNNGINIYDFNRKPFNTIDFDEISENTSGETVITSITADNQGNLWFASWGSGIFKYDVKKKFYTQYLYQPGADNKILNNVVRNLYVDNRNNLWIATDGAGINIFNLTTNKMVSYSEDGHDPYLPDNVVNQTYQDRNGNYWLGLWHGGLLKCRLSQNNKLSYRQFLGDRGKDSLSYKTVTNIYEDHEGTLWISTKGGGLNKILKKDRQQMKFRHYNYNKKDSSSLSSNEITLVYEDKHHTIWVCTNNDGLCKYIKEKEAFRTYTTTEGLPSNIILGILEDDNSNLWLSTTNGISKFNTRAEKFTNYNVSDGLKSNSFFENSFYKDKKGVMYFGGSSGVTFFHPDSIKNSRIIPPVFITDFQIFNKKVKIGEKINGRVILKKSITETHTITISYEESVITLSFAALHFSAPLKNKYAYKMEGFDKEWRYTSAPKLFETYTNLDPGTYIFHVKASNNDGVWNEKGTSLKIIITPPFWKTWWFIILSGMILIYLIFAFFRFRTRSMHEQNLLLEDAVKQKSEEMKDLMEKMLRQEKLATIGKISTSIAHELRNPLGAVKQAAYFLKIKNQTPDEKIHKHLDIIDRELSIADRVIDDLLEMTREKQIKKERIRIKELVNMALNRCNLNKDITTVFDFSEEAKYVNADPLLLLQVFVNLIINAVQAMEENGKITFKSSLNSDKKYIQLSISDDGPGIKTENLDKIFEPLYTTKAKGTGIGLSICKQIIEKHGGSIKAANKKGKGTQIIFNLPNL